MKYNKQPLVSYLIPAYNAEEYILQTVDSILSQSYSNIEILILDDGSVDGTYNILQSINDSRVTYYSRENKGLSITLAELADRASGEFFARIDSDDLAHPDRTKLQVEFLQSHPKSVLVGTDVIYIDHQGNYLGFSLSSFHSQVVERKMKKGNIIFHPSVMFRSDVYRMSAGYDLKINKYVEDLLLWKDLGRYGDLSVLPKPLTYYRIHNNAISSKMPKDVSNIIARICANNGVYPQVYSEIEAVDTSIYDSSDRLDAVYKFPLALHGFLSLIKSVLEKIVIR